jgi:hypothetical protein
VALGALPLVILVLVLVVSLQPTHMADFHVMRDSGSDVLHGRSPYPPLDRLAIERAQDLVYPAPVALVGTPFSLIGYSLASVIWVILMVGATVLTLRILGVTDWRCYGAVFLSASVMSVYGSGALSSILALGVAVVWKYRDRPRIAGPVLALVIVAKIFLWPLLLWLLVTRRTRATALAAATGVAVTFGSWAAIGFAGLTDYPRLLNMLADVWQWRSYSPQALWLALGVPNGVARVLVVGVGIAALGAIVLLARREDGDRRALTAAILAALLLSPIVWLHYFVLILVPLALARPRFSALWLVPVAFWLVPLHSDGVAWRIAFGLLLVIGMAAVMALRISPLGLRRRLAAA